MKLNLALGELPNFTARPSGESAPHHNATIHIAPDVDYLQRAYEDAKGGLPSTEPMLEMFLQTPSDFTLAPFGAMIDDSCPPRHHPYPVVRRRDPDDPLYRLQPALGR